MMPHQFVTKWSASTLTEKGGSQEHFIDLCRVLGQPTPAEADSRGEWFCFERGTSKTDGGKGWADVWRKGCFAWEYKGKHKDLTNAFAQLQRYAPALDNPPLLVVSDMERIEIHSNFTNTVHEVHSISLAEIGSPRNLHLLKCLFSDPEKLRPGKTKAAITEEAARRFAALAQTLRDRGGEPERVAHFLNRILFCLFAQDAKLLPQDIVIQVLKAGLQRPDQANKMLAALFIAMKKGGPFGAHVIDWFNGGLFDSNDSIPLESTDIRDLLSVASLSWSAIEPSIFGTLFERGLDPSKRAQIGAHYTDPESIKRIIEPTIVLPLRVKWSSVRKKIEAILDQGLGARSQKRAQQVFDGFLGDLSDFRVLDPACGSGNFLYLALQSLKDLEHRATLEAERLGLQPPLTGMHVGVKCLQGIELNSYAAELARVTVWIGEIQWMLGHGIHPSKDPILKPLRTIECRDAIVSDKGIDPIWPKADVIIGNPPFLGNKRMLSALGEHYTTKLRQLYKRRLPGGVELVTYWFERAREAIESGRAMRTGFVATQAIRKGANRAVLDRITAAFPIFNAWSDEPWINDGAAVRVSLVAFGKEGGRPQLNGREVKAIRADLSSTDSNAADLTQVRPIPTNRGICLMGTSKVGAFDIPGDLARTWLKKPNPKRLSNADVLRPWANGQDLVGRPSDTWIVDFGTGMPAALAALYEAPFTYIEKNVRSERSKQRRDAYRKRWWIHAEARPGLRAAMRPLARFIATPRVAKHRFFVWLPSSVLPDSRLFAICRDDDFTFGLLSSRLHTVWALANASRHGVGNDPTYNASDCFETFPFPTCSSSVRESVANAARQLNDLREDWLHPPSWVKRIQEDARFPPRIVAKNGHEADLKERTLTKLYNERPAWLENAHLELDLAVAKAYGWKDYSPAVSNDEVVSRLVRLNQGLATDLFGPSHAPIAKPASTSSARLASTRQPSQEALERRSAVVCTLVNRLADDRNFGRTKMAKLFYLVDATQDLRMDTSYQRRAAGPLDAKALYDAETGLEAFAVKRSYVSIEKTGRKITYSRGPNLDEALSSARKVLGAKRNAINRLIDRFRKLDTDQCEIVATLYACWNDRLLDVKDAGDAGIIEEFLNAWHEKKRRFSKERLQKALVWMKANDLVPSGKAAHTLRRSASTAN